MPLVACGINHKTAPLKIREQVFFLPEEMPRPLLELVKQAPVSEAAILSTCNRTEIYCETVNPNEVLDWLKQRHRTYQQLDPYLYAHSDHAAVRHIMRVASGLDSMLLGEPQILGQLKTAVTQANLAGTLGTQLHRLFQYVFSVTKQVRTDTTIGASPVSIVYAAVTLAKRIFANLQTSTALLIGAGEVIELAAKHLHDLGIQQLIIANRTALKAQQLASRYQAKGIAIGEIAQVLPQADIILSATSSSLPILGKGAIESAIKIRKRRPMFILDLAVPRDIEAEVSHLPDVYLYTVDDLQGIIAENLQQRQAAAQQAEKIIDIQATNYMKYLRSLEAVTTIRACREKIEALCDGELSKAYALLARGKSPNEVLQSFARALTNKVLHTPTIELRRAAYDGQMEVVELARQLFDIKDEY